MVAYMVSMYASTYKGRYLPVRVKHLEGAGEFSVTEGVWFLAPGLCESSPGPYHGRVKKNTDPWKSASILIFSFGGMT